MHRIVNDEALDTLFRAARSHYTWLTRPISDTLLRAIWELVKTAPTSGLASSPSVRFVRSAEAKTRLAAAVPPEQRAAVLEAPVAAVVGHAADSPHAAAALRDGALRAGYLILAARALGLDCGPVWEFDAGVVEDGVFRDGRAGADLVLALGYGDDTHHAPAEDRRGRDEACEIL